MSDLACVGKEGGSREHGRPPRCADVDAAKLSSMQSAQKEGLSALTLLSAFWHVRAGTRCRGSPGLPGATPRFWFLFGNRVDGNWDYPAVGVLRWFEMVAFLASASAISWRYQLPHSIT